MPSILFRRATATQGVPSDTLGAETGLSEEGDRATRSSAMTALKRASAVRAAASGPDHRSSDSAAADLILEARDDLLRTLSVVDADRLVDQVLPHVILGCALARHPERYCEAARKHSGEERR